FFFFQAEDGIRDWSVTGVQTCALPIYFDSRGHSAPSRNLLQRQLSTVRRDGRNGGRRPIVGDVGGLSAQEGREPATCAGMTPERSEERRVGKEGREGWSRDH